MEGNVTSEKEYQPKRAVGSNVQWEMKLILGHV